VADCSQGQARFHSTARIRLKADGTAQIESSFCDIGTGPATIFPQIAGEVLGLDPKRVTAVAGDSDLLYSGPTYGSGTTISTGAAVQQAAQRVRAKLARLAGWPAEEITMRDGQIIHGDKSRTIREVLGEAGVAELVSDGTFDLPGGAPVDMGPPEFPARTFGVIFVEVGVDQELGLLRLRRATGVYSAGRIINPRTARSQMIGGIVWGWGMAAMEASHFEPALGRWLAKDLAGVPFRSTLTFRLRSMSDSSMNSTPTRVLSAPRASVSLVRPAWRPPSPMLSMTRPACAFATFPSHRRKFWQSKRTLTTMISILSASCWRRSDRNGT
jgi:xanthine dehydrogenase YagR molybdenum-binding subunit